LDEVARIASIRALLHRDRDDVVVGIGDDAAVLARSESAQVLSVDVQVEGVHFRRAWLGYEDLGHRAYHAAASDLAAMGAAPRAALLSLILPAYVSDEDLDALVQGIGAAADDVGAPVVGGNLARGGELSITTTVIGETSGAGIGRGGASPGEGVYVTGTIGGAALGLAALDAEQGGDARFAPFVACFWRPAAQIVIGQRLVGVATAAADISDGLVADLGHVCHASSVGARIRADLLPTPEGFEEAAHVLGRDPTRLALAGGEDFQLVFTAPVSTTADELATLVGEITPEPGVVCLGADGEPLPGDYRGFDHF